MKPLLLYWVLIKINLKGMIEHRGAFLTWFFVKVLGWGTEFIIIWVMIYQFKEIAGWQGLEVMFLYAFSFLSYSLVGFFIVPPFTRLPAKIQSGEFDEILTKPVNSFLYLISKDCSIGFFSNIFVAISAMAICIHFLDIHFGFITFVFLIVAILGSALIHGAIIIITGVFSFWLIQSESFRQTIVAVKDFVRYPITIYSTWIQVFLTFIIPYAFVNFYPSQFFLDKNDFSIFHPAFQFFTPLIGIVLFIIAYQFWRLGVNHYKSTGS